jgi:hypothetical protein
LIALLANRIYCRYNYDHLKSFDTPEAQVLHFVGWTQRERWRWNSKHPRPSHDTVRCKKYENPFRNLFGHNVF